VVVGENEAARLAVTRSLSIPATELHWRASPPGGPGGQHANRRSTRVEVRFDVEHSPSLGPRQRALLLAAFGPVVRAAAGEERSQARNREIALERLASKIAEALRIRAPRRRTRPSAASQERRLQEKRRRSELKRSRRPTGDDG
jgi:ribosome-associated protein